MKNATRHRKINAKTLSAGSALGLAFSLLLAPLEVAAQQEEGEDDIFELSPFTINAAEDTGYRATSTLAGTRLKTDLRDVGSAITVVTEQFMEDTNSTDISDIFVYTPNTEVGGVEGNFLGANPNDDLNAEIRSGAQTQTRVRGLAAADLSRGEFFSTAIPMDSYNTDRVDIQRGANSILFGLGSPAGIVNNSLKRAVLNSDFGEVSGLYGSHGTWRATLDYNRVLVQNQLAARVALLSESQKFSQDFTYEDDERAYLALDYTPDTSFFERSRLFDRTNIRANIEVGEVNSNRPRSTPPNDGIEPWFNPGKLNKLTQHPFDSDRGSKNGTSLGWVGNPGTWWWHNGLVFEDVDSTVTGVSGTPYDSLWSITGPTGDLRRPGGIPNWRWFAGTRQDAIANVDTETELQFFGKDVDGDGAKESLKPFWKRQDILDPSVFNFYDTMLEGPSKSLRESFTAYNIALEQTFFDRALGVQFAYDRQRFKNFFHGFNPRVRSDKIGIDINTHLLDGTPNPNVGRPFVTLDNGNSWRESWDELETARATAYARLDFEERMPDSGLAKWLGSHTLTGLFEDHTNENEFHGGEIHHVDSQAIEARKVANRGRWFPAWSTTKFNYLGPSLLDRNSMAGANIPGIQADRRNIPDTISQMVMDPETFEFKAIDIQTLDPLLRNINQSQIDVETQAFILNSEIADGWLTGMIGWREDKVQTFSSNAADIDGDAFDDLDDPNFGIGPDTAPDEDKSGGVESLSWSVVGHLPDSISTQLPWGMDFDVHLNSSENFSIQGERRTFGQESIDAPQGSTRDYGFTLSLFENKFIARANWYESDQTNVGSPNDVNAWFLYGADVNTINSVNDGLSSIVWDRDDFNTYLTQNGANPSNALPDDWTFGEDIVTAEMFRNALPLNMYEHARIRETSPGQFEALGPERLAQVADTVSEGVEIEVVYNPTENWRILLNAAKQEAVASGINKFIKPFVEARAEQWLNMPTFDAEMDRERWLNDIWNPFLTSQSLNGGKVLELREWRANLITNYAFTEGRLKGFSVGGATRWMSESNIGFPIIRDSDTGVLREDVTNPFEGPSEQYWDFWVSYETSIMNDSVDWRLQLNVKNAFTNDDFVPVLNQPDGSIAAIRILDPRRVTLRSTFRF